MVDQDVTDCQTRNSENGSLDKKTKFIGEPRNELGIHPSETRFDGLRCLASRFVESL